MIELIAVMVIMGILATSTITNYSEFNKGLRIFEEVKDMSRKIIYARDYCVARKEIFYLKVDADADQYSLFRQNISTRRVMPYVILRDSPDSKDDFSPPQKHFHPKNLFLTLNSPPKKISK